MKVIVDGELTEREISHYEDFPTLRKKLPVPVYNPEMESILHSVNLKIPVIKTMKRTLKA